MTCLRTPSFGEVCSIEVFFCDIKSSANHQEMIQVVNIESSTKGGWGYAPWVCRLENLVRLMFAMYFCGVKTFWCNNNY